MIEPISSSTYIRFMRYADYCGGTASTFTNEAVLNSSNSSNEYPNKKPESEQEKRDRLSKEENKRLIEARRRGGRMKF